LFTCFPTSLSLRFPPLPTPSSDSLSACSHAQGPNAGVKQQQQQQKEQAAAAATAGLQVAPRTRSQTARAMQQGGTGMSMSSLLESRSEQACSVNKPKSRRSSCRSVAPPSPLPDIDSGDRYNGVSCVCWGCRPALTVLSSRAVMPGDRTHKKQLPVLFLVISQTCFLQHSLDFLVRL
jgi:hypothetical protein